MKIATEPRHLDVSYGIEEEFFLVDRATRDLAATLPATFMRACRLALGECVGEELLQPQVEIATPVLHDAAQARETLAVLRGEVARIAGRHDMGLVAAGTHPFGAWEAQRATDKDRYARLIDDFQIVGRRNLFCGLHVHVGIPEGHDRVALMNRLMPWVPMFLALSTSSPFWNGRRTGLLSYRQAAYDEWPRSGIPDAFANEREYDAFVSLLARCGALRDGSQLWWAVRPSARFPTLELRISDACTRIEDSLALAAAFRCLVRAHLRDPALGAASSPISRRVIEENRWRAKRYGTDAAIIDETTGTARGFVQALEDMLALVAPDAQALGCDQEIEHLRSIVRCGTSAHQQLAVYRSGRNHCRARGEALRGVVDWLVDTTESTRLGPVASRPGTGRPVVDAVIA
jgi:carboxylate-amine ligase